MISVSADADVVYALQSALHVKGFLSTVEAFEAIQTTSHLQCVDDKGVRPWFCDCPVRGQPPAISLRWNNIKLFSMYSGHGPMCYDKDRSPACHSQKKCAVTPFTQSFYSAWSVISQSCHSTSFGEPLLHWTTPRAKLLRGQRVQPDRKGSVILRYDPTF